MSLGCAAGPGLAACGPVLLRHHGIVTCAVLLAFVAVYDASAFLVGAGATRWWEGPAAGIAFIFAVAFVVAALFVPPFSGATPWLFAALAAALAPLGPQLAARLIGPAGRRVPALKRLDSLLIAGPVWAGAALLVLTR